MKRIIALIIILLIPLLSIKAQPTGFTKLLDENMKYVVDMIQTSSGNFIIVGTYITIESGIYVVSLNEEGEIIFKKYLDAKIRWYAGITQISNGNILIPNNHYLLEINQSGDSVGCLAVSPSPESFFGSVIEMPDSSIIATEIIINDDPFFPGVIDSYIQKFSPEGNFIGKFPSQFLDIKDITPCSDSTFLALVETYSSINSHIVKYNLEGEIISTSSCTGMDPYLHKIKRINDNYFAAVGYKMNKKNMQAVFTKIDNTGQIMFCDEYSNRYFPSFTKEESSEKLFILGNSSDQCYINTLDYSGNIISEYLVDNSLDGNNIIYSKDYLYIAGVYNYSEDPRSCFIKIHKDSILSVNENQFYSKMEVYPNPATSKFKIRCSAFDIHNCKIEIFDIFGIKVKEIKLPKGQTKAEVNVENWAKGLYLIKVGNGKNYFEIRKVIIQSSL